MNYKQKIIYLKNFGFFFSVKSFYLQNKVNKNIGVNKTKWADKLNTFKLEKLNNLFGDFIKEETENWKRYEHEEKKSKIIWLFWMNGDVKNVPMVNMCINSIKAHMPEDAKLILINENNIKEYSDISSNIWKKYYDGKISVTHLSDILRMDLLRKWGGIWFDATVYCTGNFDYIFEQKFWSTKRNAQDSIYIPKGRWTGFSIGGEKNLILFYLMTKLFEKYWEKFDVLIDFFLIDFFIELLYNNVEEVKKLIDNNKLNNINVQKLWGILSEEYNENEWKKIIRNTDFFKLSWRIKQQEVKNGNKTYFGMLMERNKD